MPELPEVETIRRQLAEVLPGRRIASVDILDPKLTAPEPPEGVAEYLVGRCVERLDRRGKYLLVRLDDGDTLTVHLRMTGQLYWGEGPPDTGRPHVRAVVTFEGGGSLVYCDMRRFGRWWILPGDQPDPEAYWRARVGIEPLGPSFTARRLGELLAGRRTSVKAALLDQRLVAGVGNIYADEALFQAGVHPERPAGDLSEAEVRRLHRAVRDRLATGIEAGGSSIDRYRDANGGRGAMQTLLRVHLRAGAPCPRCGTPIRKLRVAQRGTYVCERCQVAPC